MISWLGRLFVSWFFKSSIRSEADLFDLAVLDEAGEAGVVDLAAVDWGALQRLVELETEKSKKAR